MGVQNQSKQIFAPCRKLHYSDSAKTLLKKFNDKIYPEKLSLEVKML